VAQKILRYLKELKRHSKVALSEQLQQPEHGTAKKKFPFKEFIIITFFS
jgi:hypothetical protein